MPAKHANKTNGGGLEWIPWQRYVLLLGIDGKRTINLGRFRRKEGVCQTVQRLNMLKGYEAKLIDTKKEKNECNL